MIASRPNEVRLSCAAGLCLSQMQFYYDERRQLQPHVRPRPGPSVTTAKYSIEDE